MSVKVLERLAIVIVLVVLLSVTFPIIPATGQGNRAGTDISKDISTNTTWTVTGSPYRVTTSISVDIGVTLTIASGVEVRFESWSQLTVHGTLVASNVRFTSASGSPTAGIWRGLLFEDAHQDGVTLDKLTIEYASKALDVQSTNLKVTNSMILRFYSSGIEVSNGGIINITGSWIESSEGVGIDCYGKVQASKNTIIANYAIMAESSCIGFVDGGTLTANPSRGVGAESDTTLVISNNVINSTIPESSYGVYADTGSKIILKGNDIVGHYYGIYSNSGFIKIENNNIRNYRLYGVYSDAMLTVKSSFAGRPNPAGRQSPPAEGSDTITFENPLSAPFDLVGIKQPPSAAITSHVTSTQVSGKVNLVGQAWEPDSGETITKVEIRIIDDLGNEIIPWTVVDGTANWRYTWDTSKEDTDTYSIQIKATSSSGDVAQVPALNLVVNPYAGGDFNPLQDLLDLYMMVCYVVITAIIISIVLVLVYVFVYKRRKDKEQQAAAFAHAKAHPPPYQPAYVGPVTPYQQYPPQYQYQQPHPVTPKEEPYIIDDVFLIYKDGRLIHHDTRRLKPEVDDQMLGGMFTAIQEFIGQSFPSEDGSKGMIKEIMYEDSKIILEHGKFTYLAVVCKEVKDTTALHKRMSKLLKAIEAQCEEPLTKWDGMVEALSEAKSMVKFMYNDEDIDVYY